MAVGTDLPWAPPVFLVERYSPGLTAAGARATVEAVGQACIVGRAAGLAVRLRWSLVMPDDEALFLLVEAPDFDLVADVCAAAGLAYDRATPALVVGDGSE
ncbi:MAG TPA: hypothetical protein VHT75_12060 [Acidimicrobiales bacterium]|nr:hypothetical protein [Acidimicrobiales bacterium]